jgi:hypothetical protein
MQAALEHHPELVGCTFGEAHFRFSHTTPLGVLNGEKIVLCPEDDYVIAEQDEVLMLRKTGSMPQDALPSPLDTGQDNWEAKVSADAFVMVRTTCKGTCRRWGMHQHLLLTPKHNSTA